MSTPFDGKTIANAFFTNEANDTIQVIYDQGDDPLNPNWGSVYVSALDPDHYMLKSLLGLGYTLEKIAENTVAQKRLEGAMWAGVYRRYAAEEVKALKADYQEKLDKITASVPSDASSVFQNVLTHNHDVDALFKAKLAIFEIPEVKACKDRALKQSIRTAKTFVQLFGALNAIGYDHFHVRDDGDKVPS